VSVIETLKAKATPYGIEISDDLSEKLSIYAKELREWNEKINLTAILDDEGIAIKHFLDCLLVSKAASFEAGMSVIDVGTGAGFPGLVIAAAHPDVSVTLLDSTGKKLKAVEAMAAAMGVENVKIVHARAEEAGKNPEYREQYDIVCSRAVAALNVLCEYCLPFVKVGGMFVAMKSAKADEEIALAKNALKTLGGKIVDKKTFALSDGGERTLVVIKKISQVSPKYPRPSAQIAKKPL
jgi:16S rRNA (guanine(527)-N(7))-methyltransferase RsmG